MLPPNNSMGLGVPMNSGSVLAHVNTKSSATLSKAPFFPETPNGPRKETRQGDEPKIFCFHQLNRAMCDSPILLPFCR